MNKLGNVLHEIGQDTVSYIFLADSNTTSNSQSRSSDNTQYIIFPPVVAISLEQESSLDAGLKPSMQ